MQGGTPQIIGRRYQLLDLLGSGGMGTVYRAMDRLNGQSVALKRVMVDQDSIDFAATLPVMKTTGNVRLALAQEFKTLASLRHPNIISVLDYGFDDERQPFYTMDLLEGSQTILQASRGQPLDTQINLLTQMFQALAYLHRRGILHRDLKPDNVQVVNGTVKLLDFGIALFRSQIDLTADMQPIAGTLFYMAPEVLQGYASTEAADLYAAGVICYELFAGFHPFAQRGLGGLIDAVLSESPHIEALDIDARLAYALERMLEKDQRKRANNANEIIAVFSETAGLPIDLEIAARESFLQAAQFIGREAQLSALNQALGRITTSSEPQSGSAWLVGGESGVGKSRLLEELRTLALVGGAQVLRGQAVSEGRRPYQLWSEALRTLCLQTELSELELQVLNTLIPDLEALTGLKIAEPPELDPQATQNRLISVIEQVFRRQTQPIVALLEDIHWAGSESIAVMNRLTRAVGELPLLIVASYRDDEFPGLAGQIADARRLKLERLSAEEIVALSESMLGPVGRQPDLVALLQRETEGNVFFMVEVVRALAEEAGNLDHLGGIELPRQVSAGGMERMIRRRLEHIPEDAKALLNLAAVAGRQLDLKVLRAAAPNAPLEDWLNDCANAAVLEALEDDWRFSHDKLREALVADLPGATRQQLHRQAAEAIEAVYENGEEFTSALAYHWAEAGDRTKQLEYTIRAGEQALESGAYRETLDFLLQARSLADQVGMTALKRASIEHQLGEARYALGEMSESRSHLGSVLALLKQPLPVSRAQMAAGFAGQALRQARYRFFPPAADHMTLDASLSIMALTYERLAQIAVLTNDSLSSIYAVLHMLNLTEQAGPSPELARAYVNVGFICGVIPQHRWAEAYNRRALETAQQAGSASALAWVLEISSMYGIGACQWADSQAGLLRAREISDRIGDLRRRDEASGLFNVAAYFQGQFDKGYETALQHLHTAGYVADRYLPLLVISGIALRRTHDGYLDEVETHLRQAHGMLNENVGIEVHMWVYGLMSLLSQRKGDHAAAWQHAEAALERAGRARPALCYAADGYACLPEVLLALYEAAADSDDVGRLHSMARRACQNLERYAAVFRHMRSRAALWQGTLAWLEGQPGHARRAWARAVREAQQHQMPYDEGLAHFEWGRHLPASDPERARRLSAAVRLFGLTDARNELYRARLLLDEMV